MRGECVRHPTTSVKRNGYLPSSVPLNLLRTDLLVLIMYKCPDFCHAIYQEWQMRFWLHSILFRLFISPSLIFVFFKVPGSSMVGCTWNPNIECQDKQLCFWCHIRDPFTLDFQEKSGPSNGGVFGWLIHTLGNFRPWSRGS